MKKTMIAMSSVFLFLSASFPAFSLQILDSAALRQISAKGTVEIEIDNMKIDALPGTMIYVDNDGSGDGVQASVHVIQGRTIQTFASITDETDREGLLKEAYGNLALLGDYAIVSSDDSKTLSISVVDDLPLMKEIMKFNNLDSVAGGKSKAKGYEGSSVSVSGVLVNLPTLEMTAAGGSHELVFKQEGAVNNDRSFFYHEISGLKTSAILGGKIEISAR